MPPVQSRPCSCWLPGNKKELFSGMLFVDALGNASLAIEVSPRSLNKLSAEDLTIVGYCHDTPRITFTLLHAFATTGTNPLNGRPRKISIRLVANLLIWGKHLRSPKSPVVKAALVHLKGLEDWYDRQCFTASIAPLNSNRLQRITITHEAHVTEWVKLKANRRMRIASWYSGPAGGRTGKSIHAKQNDAFEFSFAKPITIDDLLEEVLRWQHFLTIALRKPSGIITLKFNSQRGTSFPFELVVPASPMPESTIRSRPLIRSFDGELACLKNWDQNYSSFETSIRLAASCAYMDHAQIQLLLLLRLQCLEVFHREQNKDASFFPSEKVKKEVMKTLREALPSSLDTGLRLRLDNWLGGMGHLSLMDRMEELFSLLPDTVSRLFIDQSNDLKFIRDARNYLTHFSDRKQFDKSFLTSRNMVVLNEKAGYLVEAFMLNRIGFSDAQITFILDRSGRYLYWGRQRLS